MAWWCNILDYKKIRMPFIILVSSALVVICQIPSVNSAHTVDFVLLFSQATLLFLIILWIYSAPKFLNYIEVIKGAFESESYQAEVERFEKLNYPLHLKKCDNFGILKVLYILIWGGLIVFNIRTFYVLDFIPCGIVGIYTTFLLGFSLVLNSSSYYSCITLAYFCWRISALDDIPELKHNVYIPSKTRAFQQLVSSVKYGSSVFLFVSLCYTVLYIINTLLQDDLESILKSVVDSAFRFSVTTAIILAFGLLTALVIFVAPKMFLSNILEIWKDSSLRKFEADLKVLERNSVDLAKIKQVTEFIEQISRDELKSNPREWAVAVSTILLNLANMLVAFYTLS